MSLMYYYCPACQSNKVVDAKDMPKDLVIGTEDGLSHYIYYETCHKCGETKAGYFYIAKDDDVSKNKAKEFITNLYNLKGECYAWVVDEYKNRNKGA